MICDVCGNAIKPTDLYVLTTSQVVYSQRYWKYWLEQSESMSPGHAEKHPSKFLEVLKHLCGSKNDWAVCTNCLRYFDVNRDKAKKWAKDFARTGRHAAIPGSGDADARVAFLGASIAWEEMYGSKLLELIKTDLSDVSDRVVFSEEIGTQRKHFWQWFKRRFE